MSRPARGADKLERAREVLAQAQAVVLPLGHGLSLTHPDRRIVMGLDGAGWHNSTQLRPPGTSAC